MISVRNPFGRTNFAAALSKQNTTSTPLETTTEWLNQIRRPNPRPNAQTTFLFVHNPFFDRQLNNAKQKKRNNKRQTTTAITTRQRNDDAPDRIKSQSSCRDPKHFRDNITRSSFYRRCKRDDRKTCIVIVEATGKNPASMWNNEKERIKLNVHRHTNNASDN